MKKVYNYKVREKHWQKYWEKRGIYQFDENSQKPIYSVDTPPPFVSAEHLHIGHIMSYSQAEFVVRFKRMQGFNVYYPMGFDDNGLPTERFVEQKYKLDKSKISRGDFIKLCLKETKIGAKNYKDLWTRLGISVDWTKTYSTINPFCQKISQWSFIKLVKAKKAYRKEEPILWCPFCQSALAQADLEDKEVTAKLNYINFKIDSKNFLVATTRPELLPACVAVFAHLKDRRYQQLKGKKAKVPLFNHEVPVYFDDSVDQKFGTGLMMVCTWGDLEDIRRFKERKLPVRQAINKKGEMTKLAGEYQGLSILKARKKIIKNLQKEKLLVKQSKVRHTVNTHERCSIPVEFILTKQWFIKLLDIKNELLKKGKKLNWYPEYMRQRYNTWVQGLKWDWCISRQRYYGVPMPVWYCQDCGEAILPKKEDLPVNPPEKQSPISKCPKCGSKNLVPDEDVMDTWATSSCTPFIIPELISKPKTKKKVFPNTLRPQAFEIIRTWLFYSIVKSFYHFQKLPFEDVMISGHGLDENGRKISKRLGNYIEPSKLLNKYGADAIRYWATGATLGSNHCFTIKEVKKGKYTVNKIWNSARFCVSYINNFSPRPEKEYQLEPEDKWILYHLNQTIKKATQYFEEYEYAKVRKVLDKFFWATFCDYYLEMVKHRANESSAKYTLFTCLLNIIKLYAPILPFVTEEIYALLFKNHQKQISLHLTPWPKTNRNWQLKKDELQEIEYFIEEIDTVRKEKSSKGLSMKAPLDGYIPKTKVDIKRFGEKLERILRVNLEL